MKLLRLLYTYLAEKFLGTTRKNNGDKRIKGMMKMAELFRFVLPPIKYCDNLKNKTKHAALYSTCREDSMLDSKKSIMTYFSKENEVLF